MPTRSDYSFTTDSERRLRAMRQTAGTVYRQLLSQGFTDEGIAAEENSRPGTRRIGLAVVGQEGAVDPLIGVTYGGDFRAEEERGVREIAVALSRGEYADRVVTGDIDGHWFMALHADRGLDHGPDASERLHQRAEEALARSRDEARGEWWRDRWLKVAEIRELIRASGFTGVLPRTKQDLQDILATEVRGAHAFANVGEFHLGDTLILLPTRPVITAALRILASDPAHLRVSGPGSPFGRGITLYDERDLTGETVERARVLDDYARRQDRKAEPTREALRREGILLALGRPARRDGRDVFLLNFSPRQGPQVHGWFTLSEIHEKLRTGEWADES